MKALDYLAGAGQRELTGHSDDKRSGYLIIGALLSWLLVTQIVAIRGTQNGLSPFEPYEADVIRAAEYYQRYGFLKDAGLPQRILFFRSR